MCSTHDEGYSVVAEKFIKISKVKTLKQWQIRIE